MGKMNKEVIQDLYLKAKEVYDESTSIKEAKEYIIATYDESVISESSSDSYIRLYKDLVNAKRLTWNINTDLLVYYVESIVKHDYEMGCIAFRTAMKFAAEKSRKILVDRLKEIEIAYGLDVTEEKEFMSSINFKDFYQLFKNVIDTRNSGSKSSHMSVEETGVYEEWMKNQGGKRIYAVCIMNGEKKYGNSEAKLAYVELFFDFCNEKSYSILKDKGYFFSKDVIVGNKNWMTKYVQIEDRDAYIHADCNVFVYMLKCVKYVIDIGLADMLDQFTFVYDYEKEITTSDTDELWLPKVEDYDPQIPKEKWIELLNDRTIFSDKYLFAMACLYNNGGQGSCTELADKYGQNMTLWRTSCGVHLAEKIANATGCQRFKEKGKTTFFVIPFLYRKTTSDEQGSFVYKLRPELYEALKDYNILDYLSLEEEGSELTTKETLEKIKNYIGSKGFCYDTELIENFYLSLKAKPFVLLAGTSGTGKTRLVRLFSEAIGALGDGRYLQVAVKPDWSDSTDLFGHINLDNEFVAGAIIEFIKRAYDDKRKLPYILCLDEMNLARVEYYLSDFLSIVETRDWDGESIKTDKLIPKVCYSGDKEAEKVYSDLRIPENLYVIGTVNMDETTFPFSKKVLDRANTIEFSYVDFELPDILVCQEEETIVVDNSFLKSDYLRLQKDCGEQWETVKTVNNKIESINEILKMGDSHFGYRVRDEIIFYMLYREKYDLLTVNKAFDNQIMQKILPRIQGSSDNTAQILKGLFRECAGSFSDKNGSSDSRKMENVLREGGGIKYPKSAEKIAKMLRRFEDDDFTSYWV